MEPSQPTAATAVAAAAAPERFEKLDRWIAHTMARVAMPAARLAVAIVFIWFGALKLTGDSPAIELVTRTVYWVNPAWFVPLLGWWEIAIGVCVLDPMWWVRWLRGRPARGGWFTRIGLLLLFLQMPGTFLPLVLLPDVCFQPGGAPTLEGQYIVKNLALIAATLFIGGTVSRGARAGRDGVA